MCFGRYVFTDLHPTLEKRKKTQDHKQYNILIQFAK